MDSIQFRQRFFKPRPSNPATVTVYNVINDVEYQKRVIKRMLVKLTFQTLQVRRGKKMDVLFSFPINFVIQ